MKSQKVIFIACIVGIFIISSCNKQKVLQVKIDTTNNRMQHDTSHMNDEIKESGKMELIYRECIIDVCNCPNSIGPDFNSLYIFIDLVYPKDDSIKQKINGNSIWVVNDEIYENTKGISYFDKRCIYGQQNTIRFFGSLYYIQDTIIDSTTKHKYSGYYFEAKKSP